MDTRGEIILPLFQAYSLSVFVCTLVGTSLFVLLFILYIHYYLFVVVMGAHIDFIKG